MKREPNLSTSTLRHRYGALARLFGCMVCKHPKFMARNRLRLFKHSFPSYSDEATRFLSGIGKESKHGTGLTASILHLVHPNTFAAHNPSRSNRTL